MPPIRKTYRRRRTRRVSYRRRRTSSRATIYGRAGRQLWKDVNTLKNLINVEFKQIEGNVNTTITTTANVSYLSSMAAGDDWNQRSGRQVRYKSLQVEGYATLGSTTNTHLRLMVVIIKDWNNQASLSITELLDASSGLPVTMQMRNLNNRKNFLILKDKHITLNSATATNREFRFYMPIDVKAIYDGLGGSNTDVESGMICVVCMSDQTGIAAPALTMLMRLRFLDN